MVGRLRQIPFACFRVALGVQVHQIRFYILEPRKSQISTLHLKSIQIGCWPFLPAGQVYRYMLPNFRRYLQQPLHPQRARIG